jgi:uroporphyrinogen decarboxylase
VNSRERFFNMLQGKPVDRRPFGALLSLYGARLTGCPLARFYNDPKAYAQGQDAVRQAVSPDFLVGPFLLAGYGEAFGSKLRYSEHYVPTLVRPAITSAAEIGTLRIPDLDTHPRIFFIRDALRRIAAAHGKEAVILGIVLNPLDLPSMIMGLDAWLKTVLTDPDGTRRMLEITTLFFIQLCERILGDGADAIAMPAAWFTRDVTTPRLVSEFALPALRKSLQQVKGPIVFHHTGSSFFEYLDLLDGLPGVAGFTLDVGDDLPAARNHVRKECILFAGLDGPSLHTLTADGIRSRCLTLLAEQKEDDRFVPFATGTDVDLQTPLEHLLAIRQAVEEYRNG